MHWDFHFAVRTGLEPATSGETGRHSNQLNYRTTFLYDSTLAAQFLGNANVRKFLISQDAFGFFCSATLYRIRQC